VKESQTTVMESKLFFYRD